MSQQCGFVASLFELQAWTTYHWIPICVMDWVSFYQLVLFRILFHPRFQRNLVFAAFDDEVKNYAELFKELAANESDPKASKKELRQQEMICVWDSYGILGGAAAEWRIFALSAVFVLLLTDFRLCGLLGQA